MNTARGDLEGSCGLFSYEKPLRTGGANDIISVKTGLHRRQAGVGPAVRKGRKR